MQLISSTIAILFVSVGMTAGSSTREGVLKAILYNYEGSASDWLRSAQNVNASVTIDDVKMVEKEIIKKRYIQRWYYEVIMAGALVNASEDEILASVSRKAIQQFGGQINFQETSVRATIRRWLRYCLNGGLCERKRVQDKDFWRLTRPAVLEVIKDTLYGEDRRAQLSIELRINMANVVKGNIDVSVEQLSEIFRVPAHIAQDIKEEVLEIFQQPAWLVPFIRFHHQRSSDLLTIIQYVRNENQRRRSLRVRGDLNRTVAAWLELVVKQNHDNNWIQEGKMVRIKPEAIKQYFAPNRL
jgi:hypothetical protein